MPRLCFPSLIELACSESPVTEWGSSQFPWPPSPSPVRSDWHAAAIQYLPCTRGDFYTWDSYLVWFSSLQKQKDNERKPCYSKRSRKNLFLIILKDMCLLCRSLKRCSPVILCNSRVFLCAGLVRSMQEAQWKGLRKECLGASRDTQMISRDICKG